jgi:SAM-dependent methyltransferase
MDAPGLDVARHHSALRALSRINVLSLSVRRIWDRLRDLAPSSTRPLRVLDVACGGGDIALALKGLAGRAGVDLQVEACDLSPVALDFARDRARRKGLVVDFFKHDATAEKLPGGFDLVCSSLFLHHLSQAQSVGLLQEMARAGREIIVQDLQRTRLGYLLAMAAVRVVTRSRIVHVDGLRSVRSAYSIPEASQLAQEAGLEGARTERCWPERFVLHWRRA